MENQPQDTTLSNKRYVLPPKKSCTEDNGTQNSHKILRTNEEFTFSEKHYKNADETIIIRTSNTAGKLFNTRPVLISGVGIGEPSTGL